MTAEELLQEQLTLARRERDKSRAEVETITRERDEALAARDRLAERLRLDLPKEPG